MFQETLFGPEHIDHDVDFAADFPKDWRPNLPKELQYFRKFGDTTLTIDMLLSFTHFNRQGEMGGLVGEHRVSQGRMGDGSETRHCARDQGYSGRGPSSTY